MPETPPVTETDYESPVSSKTWYELKQNEFVRAQESRITQQKAKKKAQFTLIIICLLAVIYTYPVSNLAQNPTIDIKAIALSVPLKDAIAIFPTILACCYLSFISAVINHALAASNEGDVAWMLTEFERSGKIPRRSRESNDWLYYVSTWIFSPTLLPFLPAFRLKNANLYYVTQITTSRFIGAVFTTIPFASSIFITIRAYELLGSVWVLIWDIICISIMLLTIIFTWTVAYRNKHLK